MISAAIVLYNTKIEDVKNVIKSYAPNEERYLILIENSKQENNYCKRIANENIEYIHNNENIGYGAAHNIGIKRAISLGSNYHIVLNPDLQFNTNILNEMKDYADKCKDVGYILPKILYPNGEIQYLCKLLPTPFELILRRFLPQRGIIKRMNDRYVLKDFGYDKVINPPCLSGCFMFMRTEILKEYGILFDEKFFMYCEDFDFIRRLHRVSKTIYYPYVTIIHNHEKASYKDKKMLLMHIKSACVYFNKYGWIIDRERNEMNERILSEIRYGVED